MSSITQDQVTQVQTACTNIQLAAQAVYAYSQQVSSLLQNNWIEPITLAGATIPVDFSGQAQQDAIAAQYQTLKAGIVTAYNTLP